MKKWLNLLILSMLVFVPIQAVAQSDITIQPGETVTVGLDSTFAPYGFLDDGKYTGFDIELAEEVFDNMGVDYEFQSIDWSMKEAELNNGNIDMIWNGYSKTPEREELVLFSDNYVEGRVGVLVKNDSEIQTIADLEGKKVATQEGSSQLEAIRQQPGLEESLDGGRVITFSSFNEVLQELATGRVDAIVVAELVTRYYFSQNGQAGDYRMLDEDFGITETAVGFRQNETAFVGDFNVALNDVLNSEVYEEIENRWFAELGGDESAEEANMLAPLLDAAKTTLLVFFVVLIVSIPLGLIIALLEQRAPAWIKAIIQVYVYVFRGSPLLLQLMVVYFGLPFLGITLDRVPAALATMIINYAAYLVEIFRGGLNAIPQGQYESLKVLSINKLTGYRRVILPQLWKVVMPSVGNEVISLVKDTSLIYILGLDELLKVGRALSNQYASMMPYLYVGVIYLALTGIVTIVLNQIEKRIDY
ncbi:ABC transporter permease subunit [Aerococcaceae bacterium INB8]|uniref:ABC transporter permease subunit n=1 Tax=Ruoffia halotolerans TaxID=2748684 RepID=A0A839A8G4_9LACT|nr:ABC transporter permease subunit [Ruoffia halotolerans]MBA5730171.1 ABC transporter permease subunit [Ruoffia halotolerans]